MKTSIRIFQLCIGLSGVLLLSACGNKGPLFMPSALPPEAVPVAPVETPAPAHQDAAADTPESAPEPTPTPEPAPTPTTDSNGQDDDGRR